MRIKAESIQWALKILDSVPFYRSIATTEYFKMDFSKKILKVSLSGGVVGYAEIPLEEGSDMTFYAERKALSGFVFSCDRSGFILMELDNGGNLVVKRGRRRAVLHKIEPVSGYGKPKRLEKMEAVQLEDDVKEKVDLARNYASPEPAVPKFQCVYLHPKLGTMSSNGNSALIHSVAHKKTLPIPYSFAAILASSDAALLISAKSAALRYEKEGAYAHLIQMISKETLRKFPAKSLGAMLKATLSRDPLLSIEGRRMYDCASRMLSLVSASTGTKECTITVVGKSNEDVLRFHTQISQGKLHESLKLKSKLKSDVTMTLALDKAMPFLKSSVGHRLQIREDKVFYGMSYSDTHLLLGKLANQK